MLDELGWRSLKQRRTDQRLIMFYKIVNARIEVDTVNELKPRYDSVLGQFTRSLSTS